METQKREFLEGVPGRLVFKKTNGKQPDMKDFDFNRNGIMTLLKELLQDNNDVMVLFQKEEPYTEEIAQKRNFSYSEIEGRQYYQWEDILEKLKSSANRK